MRNIAGIIICSITLSLSAFAIAEATKIQPLGENEGREFVDKLNKQGIIIGFEKGYKSDRIYFYDSDGSFGIENNSGTSYCIYKTDINNDKEDEYVVTSVSGSGGFFDIDAIYKKLNGKYSDIFGQIKIPMRKLIRDSENASYDLEDGYVGYMHGNIVIETVEGVIYFTLTQITRNYDVDDFEKSFQPQESWKFLWDENGLKLITSQVNRDDRGTKK